MLKLAKEKTIVNDEDLFMDKMFEKLCMDPRTRDYLKDESFLTKLERFIRNPSLGSVLEKMDPRIKEAADVLMLS